MQHEFSPNTGRTLLGFATCGASAYTIYQRSILSAADSHARISATPESAPALPASDQDSGLNMPESFANYDPATCSWRTLQLCLDGEYQPFSATWPRSGTMRNGSAYQRRPLVRLTDVTEFGLLPTPAAQEPGWKHIEVVDKDGNPPQHWNQRFYDKKTGRVVQKGITQIARMWPTPTKSDGMGGPGNSGRAGGLNLRTAVTMFPTPTVPNGGRSPKGGMSLTGMTPDGKKRQVDLAHFVRQSDQVSGQLNPMWVEWLMGFPLGWTDLED